MGNNAEIKITLDTAEAERKSKKAADRMRKSEERGAGAGAGRQRRGRKGRNAGAAGGRRKPAAGAAVGAAVGALSKASKAVGRVGLAVAGGIAIQQVAGKAVTGSLNVLNSLLKSAAFRAAVNDLVPSLMPRIVNDPIFRQARVDALDKFSDDLAQKFSFEVITAQTARLDVMKMLGPFARAGLPSGRLARDDGSFTENLVRSERRRKFLERQETKRKRDADFAFGADFFFFGG